MFYFLSPKKLDVAAKWAIPIGIFLILAFFPISGRSQEQISFSNSYTSQVETQTQTESVDTELNDESEGGPETEAGTGADNKTQTEVETSTNNALSNAVKVLAE